MNLSKLDHALMHSLSEDHTVLQHMAGHRKKYHAVVHTVDGHVYCGEFTSSGLLDVIEQPWIISVKCTDQVKLIA